MDRRQFSVAVATMAAVLVKPASAEIPAIPAKGKFVIGMIIFPQMTDLDFVAPLDLFARVPETEVHVLAKTTDPVLTGARARMLPQTALRDAPELDLLFIGGGPGVNALMEDRETIDFLKARAPRAKYVTSVCTGALVLAAAGLLKGYRATTHWAALDVLPMLGAIPVKDRVVVDRNRITGGGVTAGLDFGLAVIAQLWGAERAELLQLAVEYNPRPPFTAGSPETAPPAILRKARESLDPLTRDRMAIAQRISTGI
jgi:cyclohexyl-isocyanide hydratase